jgi:glycosyltransferase involved in cell wall biosynthesis
MNDHPARAITFLTSDLGGGTGDHLVSMIRHWNPDEWRARIISERPVTSRFKPEVPVEVISSTGWLERYPLAQVRRLLAIGRSLRRDEPDLVHSFFFWSIIYGRILKKLGVVRCLVENREDEGFSWTRRDYAILRASSFLPDRVICVSEAVRDVVVRKERIDPGRTVVIHNGIGPTPSLSRGRAEMRHELGIDEAETPLVGMVANLNRPVKGVGYFLDAIPLILRSVPSARFVIFGGGKQEPDLREKARSLGIERSVTFAGFRSDIQSFYPALDVSVLTSLSEGLSISLLESMNHGLPMVVTRVGGNPEVVVEGETGFLVSPRDTPAFADRVIRLLLDPELRSRMGRAGRRRVGRDFRMDRAASRYLTVYQELLMTGHGRRS